MNDPMLNRSDDWVASGGGPLLVLSESGLPYWNGADEPGSGIIPATEDSPTDYERACSVREWVGVIPVGPTEGLVLADEPLDTRWWCSYESGPMHLIRWVHGDSTSAVLEALPGLDGSHLEPTGVLFTNKSERVVLFDSAMPGTDILTPYSSVTLAPGTYTVEIGEFEPNSRTKLLVLRLVPKSKAT
jgi:hypothetical protein